MHVRKLLLENITVHAKTAIDVPAKGIVLVTGLNGTGKSSIAEAVAFGGWGKSLRGTPAAVEGKKARVVVEHAEGRITRTRGGKASLEWAHTGAEPADYESNSHAQEALETVIGGFDTWRRRHVFSSSDNELFTTSTDKARKLFLEGMSYGDTPFDAALTKCRVELKSVETRLAQLRGSHARSEDQLSSVATRMQQAKQMLDSLGELPREVDASTEGDARVAAAAKVKRIAELVRFAETELVAVERKRGEVLRSSGGGAREIEILTARLQRLAKGTCDACGQGVPHQHVATLKSQVQAAREKLQQASDVADAAVREFDDAHAEAKETLVALRRKQMEAAGELSAVDQRIQAVAASQRARENAKKTRQVAETNAKAALEEAERLTQLKEKLGEEIDSVELDVTVLQAVEEVLGLRGVRTSILARVLTGLETAANAWLPRLIGKMQVKLAAYSDVKSTGGVNDAISVEISGAGGGYGYKATSGGERRRVDIALMLSFIGDGTLFFDEVFDAVDVEGRPAVARVLEEIAQTRAVIVITHNEEYAKLLPSALRWRVEAGQVHVG